MAGEVMSQLIRSVFTGIAAYVLMAVVFIGYAAWALLWSPIIAGLWIWDKIERRGQ